MTDVTMPRLSDSMEEGTILTWLIDDGQPVAEGDDLVEIETQALRPRLLRSQGSSRTRCPDHADGAGETG